MNTLMIFLADDAALPSNWNDMKSDLLKQVPLTPGSKEYNDVETELTKTGLAANILSVCSVSDMLCNFRKPNKGIIFTTWKKKKMGHTKRKTQAHFTSDTARMSHVL